MREQLRAVAWVFVASPVLIVIFGKGRYSVAEAAVLPVVGALMFLWYRRHPLPDPEHLAAVAWLARDDYDGPDAIPPAYAAWCDCGWWGDDHAAEEDARREAEEHAERVRPGLRDWPA